ncbi:PRC-barrel domain-containing protein [Bythopirellula polymerisocia]|uniref:PRC-barrel domain protein n=1 Tax=Bythopirellula polymerisocia TaxID=2528003 RepID=A0A5C6CYF0_9BACT|nr:PRC-barrel domain-containing protein [Bythopirellula polymerisocia]TWU27669.1 PRC-barrel domain protein [Bythopirellula polymerisocia]
MKYISRFAAGAAIAMLITSMPIVQAQTTTNANANSNRANQNRSSNSNMTGKTVRASDVIGMNIYNSQGEDVGEINDVVLAPNTGKVRYAAVTYGGFIGIGDEMFAVPWEAFQCSQDPNDPEEHRLTLDVSKQQLEGAKGFNQDNWPNFADSNFANDLDRRYSLKRNRDGNVDVDVNRRGVNVEVDRNQRNQ